VNAAFAQGFANGLGGMRVSIRAEDVRFAPGGTGTRKRVPTRFFFHSRFARLSPVFAAALLFLTLVPFAAPIAAGATLAVKRQSASSQFARAEEQRASLNEKAPEKRTLADYKQVVNSYRRVYLITPHAAEVPDALLAVAELYSEMGDRFGRGYYQSAVDTYQFLIREYPKSRFCPDAYLRSAKLQKNQLGDAAGATKTYDAFLKRFPRSKNRREALEARAELALLANPAPAEAGRRAAASNADAPNDRATAPRVVSRDRRADSDEADDARAEDSAPVDPGGRIPQVRKISVRAAQDFARVTVELDGGVQYASGRIGNPDRIYFDLHAAKLAPELLHSKIPTDSPMVPSVRVAQSPMGVVRVVLDVNGVKDYSASLLNNPSRLVIDLYPGRAPAPAMRAADTAPPAASAAEKAPAEAPRTAIPEPKGRLGTARNGKKPDLVQPASSPQPTHEGQSTLTRALGLKIGRIVIDAGHGGHDTGTIGPTGLMEKDLCLDVALRLGKIIQQRLPGADVVFTRSDDTFIPLEERTHIANGAKADMFVSIHANSSQDTAARGIETYYLNLKGSPEAMEVAARENATSDQGIHELQDLVKAIARTEKIDESREFAEDVQDSLSKRVQRSAKTVKNRGVRKAPFVVLIGADMPSILTEISFLSNPADEKLLKQPEHRQRVAEGIFQGIAGYLQSLNSMTVNQTGGPVPRRPTTSASSGLEASRNRN
jgi:N-acetylmuramoyl-L-alanine amidase